MRTAFISPAEADGGRYRGLLTAVVFVVFALTLVPIAIIAMASFSQSSDLRFPPQGFSLRWYGEFLDDEQMTRGFGWSLLVAGISAVLGTLLGTSAAVALTRYHVRAKSLVTAYLMSPLVFPGLILGVALLLTFQLVGVSIIPRIILAHTLLGVPFVIRSVVSSLEHFDPSIEEAACIHGASRIKAFVLVTLPSIQGGIVAGAVFAFVISFGEINATLFLTGPGVTTLPVQIFSRIQFGAEQVTVAAASTIQMLLVVVLVFILEKLGYSVTTH